MEENQRDHVKTGAARQSVPFHLKTFKLHGASTVSTADRLAHPYNRRTSLVATKYFEEFVARIDAPHLYWLSTAFFDHDIDFVTLTPQNSTNSSVARRNSGHVMRRGSSLIVAKSYSGFVNLNLTSIDGRSENLVRSAAFNPGTNVFSNGEPLHLRGSIFTTQLEG
jgi:hypothetical protein